MGPFAICQSFSHLVSVFHSLSQLHCSHSCINYLVSLLVPTLACSYPHTTVNPSMSRSFNQSVTYSICQSVTLYVIMSVTYSMQKSVQQSTQAIPYIFMLPLVSWRRGGLLVGVLNSGSSGPRSSLGRRHRVVLLGKTLYSYSASLHPGV